MNINQIDEMIKLLMNIKKTISDRKTILSYQYEKDQVDQVIKSQIESFKIKFKNLSVLVENGFDKIEFEKIDSQKPIFSAINKSKLIEPIKGGNNGKKVPS